MMMFDEELQITGKPPTGELLIFTLQCCVISHGLVWPNGKMP